MNIKGDHFSSHNLPQLFRKTPAKLLLLFFYFISVNLLAGYIAVLLNFPSLWGNSHVFGEYAIPIGMTWGIAHWPSLFIVGIPLLLLPEWNAIAIRRFRAICIGLFLILTYGVNEKIPFALFPAIDLLTAFFFSLIIVPPTYKENPVLTIVLAIFLSITSLSGIYLLYSKWEHRTPAIKETALMNGLFKLNSISVNHSYRELLFTIELTQYIKQDTVCNIASEMGETLFNTYNFDKEYKKIADIIFNPEQKENNFKPYPLGQIEQYKDKKDNELHFGCYLKYK